VNPASPPVERYRVAIIGAGFSGLGLAIRLRQRGTTDFVVLERGHTVGGTWRDNTYPGATCDVPSNLYSFSFAPNASWSRSFSAQDEIQTYLEHCAARFDVLPYLRRGHEVVRAAWNDAQQCWDVDTVAGPLQASVLVSARGPLSEPCLPVLPGLGDFKGTIFHSARWDHDHVLSGERVAVVGTGASAVQFVPRIQPAAAQMHVFQRTPPWVLPRRDRALSALEHALFRRLPATQLAARAAIYWGREAYVLGFVGDPARRKARAGVAVEMARRHLQRQVPDPELRARLTPSYELGCKRVLISSDYYPALCQPNVELVTDQIDRVTPTGIRTVDGRARPVDTIIFGTGFDVTGIGAAAHTIGRHGRTLAQAWERRVAAYKGMAVPDFPNLFLMVGPNTGLGHSSMVFVIESQIAYLLGALDAMARTGATSVDVRPAALASWEDEIVNRSADSVWTQGGCRSWYLDGAGRNVAIWPGSSWSYRRATRRFDLGAYAVTSGRHGSQARARSGPVAPPARVEPVSAAETPSLPLAAPTASLAEQAGRP
jgi:cation diffusion facilitator CzcD-associated flavoprotein CzcO